MRKYDIYETLTALEKHKAQKWEMNYILPTEEVCECSICSKVIFIGKKVTHKLNEFGQTFTFCCDDCWLLSWNL